MNNEIPRRAPREESATTKTPAPGRTKPIVAIGALVLGAARSFNDLMVDLGIESEIMGALAADKETEHAPRWDTAPFGRGAAIATDMLAGFLANNDLPPGVYYVSKTSPWARLPLVDLLEGRAVLILPSYA